MKKNQKTRLDIYATRRAELAPIRDRLIAAKKDNSGAYKEYTDLIRFMSNAGINLIKNTPQEFAEYLGFNESDALNIWQIVEGSEE